MITTSLLLKKKTDSDSELTRWSGELVRLSPLPRLAMALIDASINYLTNMCSSTDRHFKEWDYYFQCLSITWEMIEKIKFRLILYRTIKNKVYLLQHLGMSPSQLNYTHCYHYHQQCSDPHHALNLLFSKNYIQLLLDLQFTSSCMYKKLIPSRA